MFSCTSTLKSCNPKLDSHCPSAVECSSLSLSFAITLFAFLALNAAKSCIPFGCIKRYSKTWWSAEVEEAVSERRKVFAAACKRDEDRHAYISASRRALSVIVNPRLRHGRRLALLSRPNLTLNLHTLSFAMFLALLLPLLPSPTALLPGNRLRFLLMT